MHATPPRRHREGHRRRPRHRKAHLLQQLRKHLRELRHRKGRRAGWIWSGLAVVSSLALTVGLIRLQETACADPGISAATACADPGKNTATACADPGDLGPSGAGYRGRAVFYATQGHEVSCSYGMLSPTGRYVALSPQEYAGAAACGTFYEVAGPRGTVQVEAVDRCRECAPGDLGLSSGAYTRIADAATGTGGVAVNYRAVRDPLPVQALSFRVRPGSSTDRMALLAVGNGNRLDRLEIRSADGGWRSLRRDPDNYWTASDAGPGPYQVRLTDVFGHRAEAAGIAFAPGTTQRTSVRLYAPPTGAVVVAGSCRAG